MGASSTYEIVLKAVTEGFGKAKADILSVWKDGAAQSAEAIDRLNSEVRTLESEAAAMKDKLSKITAFRKLKKDSEDLNREWKDTQAKAAELARKIKVADGSTKGLQRTFNSTVKTAGKLKAQYNKNEAALEQMRRALNESGVSTANLSASQTSLSSSLKKTRADIESTKAQFVAAKQPTVGLFTKLKSATGAFTAELNKNKKDVPAWSGVVKAALAGLGIKELTRQLFDAGMTSQNLATSFTAIAKDAEKGQEELAFIRKESDDLGLSFVSTAKSYTGIFAASQLTNMKGEETRKIFTSIAEAMTALKKPEQNVEQALLAIEQMMNKGVVQSQELKLQLGNALPGAFELAAKAAGMTTAEFMKQLNTGKIMADDLLPKLAEVLHDKYGAAAREAAADSENAQAALNHWKNTWYDFKVAMSESGFLKAATQTLGDLTDKLKDPATIQSISRTAGMIFKMAGYVVQLSIGWGKWIAIVGGGYLVVVKFWPVLKGINAAFTMMTGLPVASWLNAYVAGSRIATVQSGLLEAAVSSLGVAVTILSAAIGGLFAGWQIGKIIGQIDIVKKAVQTFYASIDLGIANIRLKYLELKKMWENLWRDKEAAEAVQKRIDAENANIAAIHHTIDMINQRTDASKRSAASIARDNYHIAESEGAAWAAAKKARQDAANFRENVFARIDALQKKSHDDQLNNLGKETTATKSAMAEQLAAIELKAKQGLITEDDAERQKLDLQKKSAANQVALLKMYQEKELSLYGDTDKKRKKLRDKLQKALVAAETQLTEVKAKEAALQEENEKAARDKRLAMIDWEVAQEIITEKQAAEKRKQVRIDELNKEIADMKAQWAREIEVYGQENDKRAAIRDRLQAKLLKAEAELTNLQKKESDKRTEIQQKASDNRVVIVQSEYQKTQEVIRSETKLKKSQLDIQLTDLKNAYLENRMNQQDYINQKTAAEEAFAKYQVQQMQKQVGAAKAAYGEMSSEYITAVNNMEAAENHLTKVEKDGAEQRREAAETYLSSYISSFDLVKGKYSDLLSEIDKFGKKFQQDFWDPFLAWQETQTMKSLIAVKTTLEDIQKLAKDRYDISLDISGLSIDDAKKAMADLDAAFKSAAGQVDQIRQNAAGVAQNVKDWRDGFDDTVPSIDDVNKKALDLTRSIGELFSKKTFTPDAAKAALDDIINQYKDLESTGASVVDALKQQWDDLAGKIDTVAQKIADLSQSTSDTIRDLEEATMTDQQKWQDQRKRFEEAYNKAVADMNQGDLDAAQSYFKRATDIAKGLAVEVKDSAGNVVMSLTRNTKTAIDLINKASDATKNLLTKQQDTMINQQRQVSASLDQTLSRMATVGNRMQQIDTTWKKITLEQNLDLHTPMIMAEGGAIVGRRHSEGGTIIEAEHGEFVQPRSAVAKYGLPFMEAIRRLSLPADAPAVFPKFSAGGLIAAPKVFIKESAARTVQRFARFDNGGLVNAAAGSFSGPGAGSSSAPEKTVRVVLDLGGKKTYAGRFAESDAAGLVRELELAKRRAN